MIYLLTNATFSTITFLPFSLSASVTALSGLDFLGFGLPPGSGGDSHLYEPDQ